MTLHTLLALTRPLIVVDVETTGLDTKVDRIVEIGFQVWGPPNGLVKEWRSLVNPGVPIPESVTKVHHISNAMFARCRHCVSLPKDHPATCETFAPWPAFSDLAPSLVQGFSDVDFAGKNVRFDLRMLAAEFARAKVEWSYIGARIVDADRLEQLGEPRHLSNLYRKHTGKEPEDAHQALADVRMTTEVIEGQLTKYNVLPRDLDLLHNLSWPGWIDGEGKFKFVDGVPCFGQWGKHAGKPMNHPSLFVKGRDGKNYYHFIVGADFSPDVKVLAADALNGVFPEAK